MILALLLAASPPVVGVLEFRDKVPAEQRIDAAFLSDQVRAAVKEDLPQARVITRENMLVLLQSTGRKLEECEGECEVETGRRIGADLVVSGELLRFGSQYKLNMKLHDTRSGELLSGSVASGGTADELDRDLRPAVRKLLAPLLQDQLSDRREEPRQVVEVRERHPPATSAAVWLVAGYDWTSNTVTVAARPASGVGLDLGGHLFFRIAGPLYLGGLIDYSLSGPNALLAAGGVRIAVSGIAVSGGVGYASVASGGWGGLVAAEFGVANGLCLRVQGSWRRSSTTAVVTGEDTTTVLSLMGGLAVQF
jgi:hypothetical protein